MKLNRKANITVIGYPKILTQCRDIAEAYLDKARFLYYQYRPSTGNVTFIDASPDHPLRARAAGFSHVDHDIIVIGIVTAKMMTMVDKNKIIPFRAGHKAIIKAFKKAAGLADRAAFISPVEETHDIRFYETLTGLKIDIFYASDLSDYRRHCARAKQMGHSVVVSGSYTFQIAREYGLTPVFLFSDEDIFHDAYTRALETFRYNQSLEEKVSQLDIISQKSDDCIMLINNSHHLTFSNKATTEKLGLEAPAIAGRHISELFGFIDAGVLNNNEDSEIIGNFGREQILATLHPVRVGGRTAGTVLFVKKTREIAALDTRVRQKMRHKGFTARYRFDDILGSSPAIRACRDMAMRYAGSDAPVLIYGKTGTGKELFAQSIHNSSPRQLFPFVAINCATLPSDLMESELFGYVKGAFTGARAKGKQGLVDQAHLGTLFLDEVDSLPISLQAKLLRLLQEKEFIRVGGDELIPVDIRVIAACNRRPDEDPDTPLIRQDLFYRLSVLYLELPDLSQRPGDIPLLFMHFLEHSDPGLASLVSEQSRDVEGGLSHLPFKGNLRELQSIATRFACLWDKGKAAGDAAYTATLLQSCCQAGTTVSPGPRICPAPAGTLAQAMASAEKQLLEDAREKWNGSHQSMADQLGIGRTTLWRKLKSHGLA